MRKFSLMEEWKEYKARDFCSGVTDGTHDSPKPTNEGYYLITSKHLKDNLIDFSSANLISEEDYLKVITRSTVEQYDILFSMIGTIGNVVQVRLRNVDFAVKNMGIFKMGRNELKSSWLYYWLKSNCAKEYINQRLAGSTQSYLTLESLREFPLYYPGDKLADQIISVLKSLDDKIEVNRQINDNLQHQAQAQYKSWFVDFEPFGDDEFTETEFGIVPKEWKILSFEDFIVALTEKAPVDSLPEYSVTNNGIIPRDTKFNKKLSKSSSMNKVLRKDNLVFGMSREILNWGIMEDEIGGVSSAYNIYKIDEDLVNPTYLRLYMKTKIAEFNSLIGTAAREGQSLDKGQLMQKKIYVPSKNILQDFFAHYCPIMETIHNSDQESRRLAQLRDTLLPRLMSGELKVSDID